MLSFQRIRTHIKPDNVMCKKGKNNSWFVKVLDFGLAKSFDHSGGADPDMASLTDTGAIVGTPHYMSPEQLAPAYFGPADARADLYAVGVMLFELLMGRRPYRELDTMQLVFAKISLDRDPLRDANEFDAMGPMADVVRQSMAWSASDRYASAEAFRTALTAAAAEMGLENIVAAPRWGAANDVDQGNATLTAPGSKGRPGDEDDEPPAATPFPDTRGFPKGSSTLDKLPVQPVGPPARGNLGKWAFAAAIAVAVGGVATWAITSPRPVPSRSVAESQAVAPVPLGSGVVATPPASLAAAAAPIAPPHAPPVALPVAASSAAPVVPAAPAVQPTVQPAVAVPEQALPGPAKAAAAKSAARKGGKAKPATAAEGFDKF